MEQRAAAHNARAELLRATNHFFEFYGDLRLSKLRRNTLGRSYQMEKLAGLPRLEAHKSATTLSWKRRSGKAETRARSYGGQLTVQLWGCRAHARANTQEHVPCQQEPGRAWDASLGTACANAKQHYTAYQV